jgi:hypothetical protein
MLAYFIIHPVAILALIGVVVYMVFMFRKGWYSQTLMGLAAIGAIVTGGFGIHFMNGFPGYWAGPVLLIAGPLMLVFIGIMTRKLFSKKA